MEIRHGYLGGLHVAAWPGPPDRPPLLVLHGIGESWRTFAACARRWASARPVYCVDLRGHGASVRPEAGYRFADYAADVRSLLPRLGSTVDLLGHSLGGAVALYAAVDNDAVGRLVTVEPPVLLDHDWPGVRAHLDGLWRLSHRPVSEIAPALGDSPGRTPSWRHMMAEALAVTADGVFRAMVEGEQQTTWWGALLRHVTAPCLVVAADPDVPGALMTGDRLATVRTGLPGARIEVVPGAGHHVEIDRPHRFDTLVDDFLTA